MKLGMQLLLSGWKLWSLIHNTFKMYHKARAIYTFVLQTCRFWIQKNEKKISPENSVDFFCAHWKFCPAVAMRRYFLPAFGSFLWLASPHSLNWECRLASGGIPSMASGGFSLVIKLWKMCLFGLFGAYSWLQWVLTFRYCSLWIDFARFRKLSGSTTTLICWKTSTATRFWDWDF